MEKFWATRKAETMRSAGCAALLAVLLVAGRAQAFLPCSPLLRLSRDASRAASQAAPRYLQQPRMVASPGKGNKAGALGSGGEVVEGPFRGQVKDWT